ncbi:MAG: hypothetical protein HUU45_05740, partial [Leptospiraceae bacterium]|nr:hypothetical protein [Leptospiraceae bacterium]
TPLSIQYVKINSSGQVEPLSNNESLQADKNLNGIKIQFIEKDKLLAEENIKTIYYFTADVSNKGFTSNSGIEKFLKNKGDVAVSFKAASYLPHGKNFSNLKDYVQKNAEVIVMDDTGPKINSFDKNWDIRVFGTYGQPIKAFKDKYQKPLEKLFHEQRPKRLDFRFGYGKNEYQIIIKLSKKHNSQNTKQIQ